MTILFSFTILSHKDILQEFSKRPFMSKKAFGQVENTKLRRYIVFAYVLKEVWSARMLVNIQVHSCFVQFRCMQNRSNSN